MRPFHTLMSYRWHTRIHEGKNGRTVPVAVILGGTAYAVFLRYFKHKERLASARLDRELLQQTTRIDTLESRKEQP